MSLISKRPWRIGYRKRGHNGDLFISYIVQVIAWTKLWILSSCFLQLGLLTKWYYSWIVSLQLGTHTIENVINIFKRFRTTFNISLEPQIINNQYAGAKCKYIVFSTEPWNGSSKEYWHSTTLQGNYVLRMKY